MKLKIREMFGNQLRELRASTNDVELIKAIDAEMLERFEALDSMYSQLSK